MFNGDAELFETGIDSGGKHTLDGREILVELEDAGYPVHQKWLEYLKSHKGLKFYAVNNDVAIQSGLNNIVQCLLKKGHMNDCPDLSLAANGASDHALWAIKPYIHKAACSEAIPVIIQLLESKKG